MNPRLANPSRPTKVELLAAAGKKVPDIIAPGLDVLFCGINPGLYSAATGHHFARPGNRFWPALYQSGFSRRLLEPAEERALLDDGCGITNLVARATARAEELSPQELIAGQRRLDAKVKRWRPGVLALLGISAYRIAFREPGAVPGRQAMALAGAVVWVLPNPSGLNAHYQMAELSAAFAELRRFVRFGASAPAD